VHSAFVVQVCVQRPPTLLQVSAAFVHCAGSVHSTQRPLTQ
jgi:hypothetical protein